jgi:exodeoxyribonuclease VII large subunit
MTTLTLFDLNQHIRRALALNFPQAVWVTAELAQVGESRGHFYLDLVQKTEAGELIAQAQATLWASELRALKARFPLGITSLLREGLELRLHVRPDFHERYGLRLRVTDLDPTYTFGLLGLQRRDTLQTLRELGLVTQNRALVLPPVLQRVAVISAEAAAGLQDFQQHLGSNSFGYSFDCQLFNSAMQGKNAEPELVAALEKIYRQKKKFDCVVIVRGGGARLDLAAFDGLELCKAAAQMPLPVFTGIGHDVDESVLDLVAHTALKTPTAVADFLVQHNFAFESRMQNAIQQLTFLADNALKTNNLLLKNMEVTAHFASLGCLRAAAVQLGFAEQKIPTLARQTLRQQVLQLEQVEHLCQNLHPENVLRRGYSLTLKNGKILRATTEAARGDVLETRLHDGTLHSQVT